MKHAVIMALAAVLATGCGKVLQGNSAPPARTAEARILVRDALGEATTGSRAHENEAFVRTQCEMIRSTTVMKSVITRLGLQDAWGANGQPTTMDQACEILNGALTVEPYRDTQLISIRVARPDAEEAARIANEVAVVFRDLRTSVQRTSIRRSVEVIENELKKQQEKVDAAEANCSALRKSLGISVLETLDEARIPQLQADQAAARAEASVLKQRMDKLQGLSDEEMATVAAVMLNDESAAMIRKQIVAIEIGAVPADTDATVERLKVELATAVARIRRGLRLQYEVADQKAESLEAELGAFASRDDKLIAPYRAALSDVETQRKILQALRARVAQAGIELEIPRSVVEIVDPAEAPAPPGQSR